MTALSLVPLLPLVPLLLAAAVAAIVLAAGGSRAEPYKCIRSCDSDLLRPDRPCMTRDGERCCKKPAGGTTLTDCMFKRPGAAGAGGAKVRLWSDDGHAGFSRVYGPGRYSTLGNMLDMGVSSLEVPPGLTVVAYAEPGLRGESVEYAASAKTLGAWNNRITSMAVIKV